MTTECTQNPIHIDLSDVEIDDVELFLQEGSRGLPEFAASCSTICYWLCCAPSCDSCSGTANPSAEEDEFADD